METAGKIRPWLPVIIWCGVIFFASTSVFTAKHSAAMIEPILRWFFPAASAAAISATHAMVRKLGHFTEYAILFLLLYRGPMKRRAGWALILCVAYALTDEGHQMFVPTRTPSLYDVALDTTGALFSHFLHDGLTELL